MTTLREHAAKMTALGVGLAGVSAVAVQAASKAMESAISRRISNDAPRRRVAGGPVGVLRRTIAGGNNPAVLVKATGPLHLLANPTKPHEIDARRAQALRTPYGPKSKVQAPGTKGKDTWRKGVDEGRPAALLAADEARLAAVRAAIK